MPPCRRSQSHAARPDDVEGVEAREEDHGGGELPGARRAGGDHGGGEREEAVGAVACGARTGHGTGNRYSSAKRGYTVGTHGDGEKKISFFFQKRSPTCDFHRFLPPPTSLGLDTWIRREVYNGPNLGEKIF